MWAAVTGAGLEGGVWRLMPKMGAIDQVIRIPWDWPIVIGALVIPRTGTVPLPGATTMSARPFPPADVPESGVGASAKGGGR